MGATGPIKVTRYHSSWNDLNAAAANWALLSDVFGDGGCETATVPR